MYSWSRPSRAQGGEGRQTGYVVVLWAGSRKGNSPERPAWEWVSISDSVSKAPTLFSLSLQLSIPSFSSPPLRSQQLFFSFYLPRHSSPSLRPSALEEEVKKSFLMGFSQIVFTDISEIFRRKENIWTYFSLIGSLMAMFCVPSRYPRHDGYFASEESCLNQLHCAKKSENTRNFMLMCNKSFNFLFS